jgi:hypothetical protein
MKQAILFLAISALTMPAFAQQDFHGDLTPGEA